MRAAAAVTAAVVLVGCGAAAAQRKPPYRNPTAGSAVALQIRDMHRANVRRNVVYRRVDGRALRLDIYRPRSARTALPAVLIGGPSAYRAGKDSAQKIGWSQLIAASGMAAVAFDTRGDDFLTSPRAPSEDVAAAITYVRRNARALRIDPNRLCTLSFSLGTAPWHLSATMRDPQPYLRCNVVFYGPLDFDDANLKEFSALERLREHGARIAPMLVAKAGRESNPGINESIDRFAAEAARAGADVRVVTHATGGHAFDLSPTARSRAIMRQALAFLRDRLRSRRSLAVRRPTPLRLRQRCVTAAERRRVVRFTAGDRTRLIGVELGTGARGVVLAHQGGGGAPGNLCAWMPYARHLASRGYHVFVFDHRGHGSSAVAPRIVNYHRVDIDVVAAARVLRTRGATSVVLGGASLGGDAVLAAATRIRPTVHGVMTFGAPTSYVRVDGIAAVRALDVPLLFVSAEHDASFADDARQLYEGARSADKRLQIFPGSEHGAPLLRREEVRTIVDAWVDAHSPR